MPNLFSLPRGNRFCRALFKTLLMCLDHVSLLVMWPPRNLKLSTCSTTAPSMRIGGVLGSPFPVVHNHLLCLDHVEGEVVVLAPHGQVSDLIPIGCLVIDYSLYRNLHAYLLLCSYLTFTVKHASVVIMHCKTCHRHAYDPSECLIILL